MRGNDNRNFGIYYPHGEPKLVGYPVIVNNQPAIAFIKHGVMHGYITLKEINALFIDRRIPRFGEDEGYDVENEEDRYLD